MGYRRVNAETLHSIVQRLRAGDSRRRIAASLGLDRKTVNQYVAGIEEVVVPHGIGLPGNPPAAWRPAQRKQKAQAGACGAGAVGGGDTIAHRWQQGGASGSDE